MALVFKDRVQETTTTVGTGSYTLNGPDVSFQAFSSIGDGNTCHYIVTDGTDWESGLGTYTLAGNTLARTTIYESSNAGAAVNWPAGSKAILIAPLATFATGYYAHAAATTAHGSNGAILGASDIGVTVQGYDADTAKLDVVQSFTANQTFTTRIYVGVDDTSRGLADLYGGATATQDGGELRLHTSADHDTNIQSYGLLAEDDNFVFQANVTNQLVWDRGTTTWDFQANDITTTGTITQNGNAVLDAGDIGVTVQGYDANTAFTDVTNTFTASQTITTTGGHGLEVIKTGSGESWLSIRRNNSTLIDNAVGGFYWTSNLGTGGTDSVVAFHRAEARENYGVNALGTRLVWAVQDIGAEDTAAEILQLDSDNMLLGGATTARDYIGGTYNPRFQVEGTDWSTSALASIRNESGGGGSILLGAGGGTTIGSITAVPDNQLIGSVQFGATDSVSLENGAWMGAFTDGLWSATNHGTHIDIYTTPNGSTTAARSTRFASNGVVLIGTTTDNAYQLQVTHGAGVGGIRVEQTTDAASNIQFNSVRTAAGQTVGGITTQWDGTQIASIKMRAGADTTNKDDGRIAFLTGASGVLVQALEIDEAQVADFANTPTVGGTAVSLTTHNHSGVYEPADAQIAKKDEANTWSLGQTFTSEATINGGLSDGSSRASTFWGTNADIAVNSVIYCAGILHTAETGTGPAGIVFGNNNVEANDVISLVTSGINAIYINASQVADFTNTPTVGGTAVSLSTHNHSGVYEPASANLTFDNVAESISGVWKFTTGNTTYGLSTAISAEFGVDDTAPGAIKLWGATAASPSIIQTTTNNLHIDAANNVYFNFYDTGGLVYFGPSYTINTSTGAATLGAITQSGQNVLDAADIGVSVQAYDAATAKEDEVNVFTVRQDFGIDVDTAYLATIPTRSFSATYDVMAVHNVGNGITNPFAFMHFEATGNSGVAAGRFGIRNLTGGNSEWIWQSRQGANNDTAEVMSLNQAGNLEITGTMTQAGNAVYDTGDASSTNVVNKLVLRDSNGDFTGRYVNGSYMNMSHSSSTRNSDTTFYSSTDNYIRKNNLTGMLSSLGLTNAMKFNTSNTASVTNGFHFINNDTAANVAYTGCLMDFNLSGADALTADRTHRGLYVDIDSSATGGDVSNEHRIYGVQVDTNVTGDSDLVYSMYHNARAAHTAGTITVLCGNYNLAQADAASAVSNAYGTQTQVYIDGANTPATYALYARALAQVNASGTIPTVRGLYGEVETTSGMAGTITTAYAVQAIIDNNDGAGSIGTGYLFYGDYQGTLPTTAWGVYIPDNVGNYFNGTVSIGATSNLGYQLGVTGDIKCTGAFETEDSAWIRGKTWIDEGGAVALWVGADSGANTVTANTTKIGRFAGYHYADAGLGTTQEPVAIGWVQSTSTTSSLALGGGSSLMNAVEGTYFYAAANDTTVTGTNVLQILDTSIESFLDIDCNNNDVWARNTIIAAGTCSGTGTLSAEFGVSSTTKNSTGRYTWTMDAAHGLTGFQPSCIALGNPGAERVFRGEQRTSTTFIFRSSYQNGLLDSQHLAMFCRV